MKRKDGNRKGRPVPRRQIQVTAEDIAQAIPKDSTHCMIARAIAREVGVEERYVSVDLQLIEFTDPKRHVRVSYLTPDNAQVELLAFDHEEAVSPFVVRLSHPIQVRPSDLGRSRDDPARRPPGAAHLTKRAERDARVEDLQRRDAAGESLDRRERASLTRMLRTDAEGGPMMSGRPWEPRRVIPPSQSGGRTARVEGGDLRVPTKNRILSNRRGKRRVYGMRATL